MPEMDSISSTEGQGGLTAGLATVDTSNVLPDVGGGKQTEQQIIDSMNQPDKVEQTEQQQPDKVVDEVKDEQQVEQTDEEKALAAQKDEETDLTVSEEDLSVAKIQQFAKEIPELKAAFDTNPQVRNTIFAMARRSARLGEYQGVLPTVEAAKFAAENSESFMALNDLFFSENKENTSQFWNQLYDNSLLRDPQTGEIVVDKQTGAPVSTGAYERVTTLYREALYGDLGSIADRIADPEQRQAALDAINHVKELAGDAPKKQTEQQQLSPEIKAKLDKADRLEQELNGRRTEQVKEFHQNVFTDITTTVRDDIKSSVERMVTASNIALTPYEQRKVVEDIFGEIDKLASTNKQYQLHFDNLLKRAPLTETGRKSLVVEARKFAKEVLPSVAQKVIREASSSVVEKTATKTAKRVEQASHREVKASGGAPRPTHQDLKSKAMSKARELKRPLTEDEILAL